MKKFAIISAALALAGMLACGGNPAATVAVDPLGPAPGSVQPLQKIYTEHLGQLTNTALNPLEPLGFNGTDLGMSFERGGKIIFLFGDSRALDSADQDDDSIASIDIGPSPVETRSMPKLTWYERPNGRFLPVLIPGVNLKALQVPVEGISRGDRTYVLAASGFDPTHYLAMSHTEGFAFDSLTLDERLVSDRFLNVSAIVEPGVIWLIGSTPYHRSNIYLAKVAPDQLANRAAWQYYRGHANGTPVFGLLETEARPILNTGCIGEISVRTYASLGYLLEYSCDQPAGVFLRLAHDLAGP